jgi:hypothetical protein
METSGIEPATSWLQTDGLPPKGQLAKRQRGSASTGGMSLSVKAR